MRVGLVLELNKMLVHDVHDGGHDAPAAYSQRYETRAMHPLQLLDERLGAPAPHVHINVLSRGGGSELRGMLMVLGELCRPPRYHLRRIPEHPRISIDRVVHEVVLPRTGARGIGLVLSGREAKGRRPWFEAVPCTS